ncbi:MAG: glycoside hydrolase family 31 protein [Polyangiaceae bacterium]
MPRLAPRFAPLVTLTLVLAGGASPLVGCGSPSEQSSGGGGASTTTSGTGGVTGGTGGTGGSTDVPSCHGVPIPKKDLPTTNDGKTALLPCPGQTLSVTFVDPAVARLTFDPPANMRPSYAVTAAPKDVTPVIGGEGDTAIVCTDDLMIEVNLTTCALTATDKDAHILVDSTAGMGGVEKDGDARTVRFHLTPESHFYGFGDKLGPLDKLGRTMTFRNTDAYDDAFGGFPPDADPLYASVPFFVGLRGGAAYGYFFDDTHALTFDMGASDSSAWSVRASSGVVDQYIFAGPRMADVLARYTGLTGHIPLPPRWSLGYHQSRWGYAPDSKVLAVADELRSRKIPADALWLDIQHMDGFRSFTWDPANFPDPAGLVQSLADKALRTVAIVDPGVKVDPAWDVYQTGLQNGYFLKGQDGNPYVGKVWPGEAVFPDFSDPAVRAFWGSLVPRTVGVGVSGLWIDMNEPSNFTGQKGGTVPDDLACAGDGLPTTMAEVHNVYALLEANATYEGMLAASPDERPFLLTRAGYAGTQRYAAMWTGDAPSSWATLQGTLPLLLGMGLSGLTFSGSDVGGYSGDPSPELFARWMEVGSFSPFFRDHVTTGVGDQEPWQFGVEVTDVSRAVIEERYRLLPYLYSLFREASVSGAPVLRPLVYEFQDDPATYGIGDEAMLGPSLLLAPVLESGATSREVYLPKGRWFEARSGAIYEGPGTFTVDVVLAALPTFVREGAIVPRRDLVQSADEKPIQLLSLDVYPAEAKSTFALYEDDGHSLSFQSGSYAFTPITAQRTASGATIAIGPRQGSWQVPARTLELRVRRVDHAPTKVTLGGQALSLVASYDAFQSATKGYYYDDRDLSILVRTPDPGEVDLALDYDPSITAPAPDVPMDFEVTVPAGTPQGAPITFASSANGWTHAPMTWIASDKATATFAVPRGKYLYYKFARGGWSTVEKWPNCVEATNRYELGAAHPTKRDTVWMWADMCP